MKLNSVDNSNEFDWGRTSADYSKYRPGYPEEFYDLMSRLGIGVPKQRILDLGTGTGVLARAFAKRGAIVTGIDIAREQIAIAKQLSKEAKLHIKYITGRAENHVFPPRSFDLASAGQSWLYFNHEKMLARLRSALVENGRLALTHLSWLPLESEIVKQSEALVLKYNPDWKGANYKSGPKPFIKSLRHLPLFTHHRYTADLPFTRESWKGRLRACRGIGATLDPETVVKFDKEHDTLLKSIAPESFTLPHEILLHVYGVREVPGD